MGVLRRFLSWLTVEDEQPRRGRQDVWAAQDAGLLPSSGGEILVKARPKPAMSLRVYRAATGIWEDSIEVPSEE